MTLKNMKTDKGFTIVELLIVIVIIGILAAITIVAYNGIQNRGKLSSAQSAANIIVKKAEAYNAVKGTYPVSAAEFADTNVKEANIAGQGTSLLAAATALDASNGTNSVKYEVCTTGGPGARIQYFDYVANTASGKYVYAGSTCTAWAAAFAVAG
ncbi:Fimbrial protein precursor [compost metagenome]